jgi:BirA family transcriptional regulator, biotin operon repressor / biotin---[acetyl-CoA-carboxylase] ligase
LKPEDIQSRTHGTIGRKIFIYDTVSSTNTVALELAENTLEGTVVLADSQGKGRGRLDRTWISPPGVNLYMSVILKPDLEPKDITLITVMSAVACADALRKTTGLKVSIKWPNDLIIHDRKLGGILTEIRTEKKGILFAVVGIGININTVLHEFPQDIRDVATSTLHETGRIFSREEITAELLNEMDRWYMVLKKMDRKALLDRWMELSSTLGKQVVVSTAHESLTGLAESIDDGGMLILRLLSGQVKKIHSGDLTELR